MRKKHVSPICLGFLVIVLALALAGCWDANYLTNKKMLNGLGFDAAEDGRIAGTARAIILKAKGGGQFDVSDELVQATGDSIQSLGMRIDSMLPGTIEASKSQVIVIGQELAKKGIMSPLEPVYRSHKGFLNGSVLISEGSASEIISVKQRENTPAAFDVLQMVRGAERVTNIPKLTMYSLWTQFDEPGEDNIVPYIYKTSEKTLILDSIALLDGDRYTGITLPREESVMLLLLKDRLSKLAYLNIPAGQGSGDGKETDTNVVTIEVQKQKRKLHVSVDPDSGEILCSIKLDLYAELVSYPGNLGREIDRGRLNQDLSEVLNKEAASVAAKLQKANCDALGIGRRVGASQHKLWETIDWKTKYREVKIKPEVQVHLTSTGILH
ncbi:Ger(x)C family spore germination protein [Paenibacillus sp. HJGM_3]|uniref:Ger(x)C family spore germination protein n=1 Tax=Paenibacillus sp. HJGM_3 TaxID=3379816 RepID=UPI003858DBC2